MLAPLVLPNKKLGTIQLLGVVVNTTIPFFEQQREKLKTFEGNHNSVALTELAVSFYTRGLLQHLKPMIQIETGQKGVKMFGIENLETILKTVPKTQKESSDALDLINDFLENLDESVTLLQQEANKILETKKLQEVMSREEVNVTTKETYPKIPSLVFQAYSHLIEVLEKGRSLPETIPWPIVLVPRSANRIAAISTAFYTPPALFKTGLLNSGRSLRLFTLISSPEPVSLKDKEQFLDPNPDRAPLRVKLMSRFGEPPSNLFKDHTKWKRPSMKVNLEKRKIKITVPATWLKTTKPFSAHLRHSSYMVAFYAYIKLTRENVPDEYFSVSFDVGINTHTTGRPPRFSPTTPVVLSFSPTEATHNREKGGKSIFSNGDLKKWVMTQDEIQHLFDDDDDEKSKPWVRVAAHVTRIYIGTTTGGVNKIKDRSVPEEYDKFYQRISGTPHQTVGWASLQKAMKLTLLTFSQTGKSTRVDMVRDFNVDVSYET